MNPRYQPGGDKYESIREDERRAFWERVDAEREDIISALKTQVSCWTENEIEAGNEPTFEHFIDEYPEWDVEELYASISEEVERVSALCKKDAIANIANGLGELRNANQKAVGEF